MGHREVKRVPLDFDHPLKKVWPGYLCDLDLPTCPDCEGRGYHPHARAMLDTFYPHQIAADWSEAERERGRRLAWGDKIGQAEVDNLVEHGRLGVWRGGKWVKEPRTADEINAENRRPGLIGHDAVNQSILVEFRCKVLGIPFECPTCEGQGDVGTPEQRAAVEAWEPTEPPVGEGWQLWETTSEGSPTSPVFATAEALAKWCAVHATVFADIRATREEWLRWFTEDSLDVSSLMVGQPGFVGVLGQAPGRQG